ncbi:MAG TPA: type IV pilin protein [Coxiellaceae bacterium]|nr:type IV pilin protein [Coxiellaceae bacterium]
MKKQAGFSITEILIVLVIMSILVLLFMPSFDTYTLRANRSDGIKTLMAIQLAEEKYRINHATYGALADVWTGTASYENYYTMAVTVNTATAYTITATATGTQTGDTECTTLTVSYSNGTTTKSPANCW